ncbi:MAG: hypothetical protein ACYDBJ_01630 [Aggregatilineales bacterium]
MLRQSQGVEVSCIHETSNELISLAGLPIALDIESIKEIAPVLEACNAEQDSGIERELLAKGLGLTRYDQVEDHPLWSLFEQYDGNHYMLSGLGSIALAELNARIKKTKVWLSRQAAERFEAEQRKGSEAAKRWQQILDHISDRDWRDRHRHEYKTCEFPASKLDRTQYRAFYDYDASSNQVLILELAIEEHGEYDKVPINRKDFGPHTLWTSEKEER